MAVPARRADERALEKELAEFELPPELTPEEGRAIFDEAARRRLGMSGDEFIRRWEAGEFDEGPERLDVMHVAMLLPLVQG